MHVLETTGQWAAGGATRPPIEQDETALAAAAAEADQAAANDAALAEMKAQLSGVQGFAGAL